MKEVDIFSKPDVQKLYDELYEDATKANVKATLSAINKACEKMVDVNATPSVPAIVKALASQGILVSERTIYNRREGKNPYPILIDCWIKVAQSKQLGISALVEATTQNNSDTVVSSYQPNSLITEEDLMKITDPVLRYKISVLYGQMTSLTKQNLALRGLRDLPAVYPDYHSKPSTTNSNVNPSLPTAQLDSLDVEILRNFLNGQNKQLYFDDEGVLYAARPIKTHTPISDPGFKEVIEKILPQKLLL
ncbi:hypothetical protein EFU27_00830 [Vibrio cholerae]|uniref:hypothetical protein n=1 Tax=Vibrio TaxID=662 RepID=UPI001B81883A|nr:MULTISPECIES: hypothetical protein [Vibrio]EGR1099029.1 hypothetical protein [Vibrio cholerae]MCG9651409.1 hypothetical protein [Vibrio vulnificus]MDV2361041.1 hypothetical protein [Vibrio cholerae]HBC3532260.1 hypothetical protein [Vibrio vulnificus]